MIFTLLDCRKSIPFATWKTVINKSIYVNSFSMSVASLNHSGWNISLFERRKFRRFPWGQHSKMTHSFPPLVQAPSKFTIFLCSPKWIRIFSSEAKSLYSVSAASSKEIIFIRIEKSVIVWAWTKWNKTIWKNKKEKDKKESH